MKSQCQSTTGNNCKDYAKYFCPRTCAYAIMMEKIEDKFRIKNGLERFVDKSEHAERLGFTWNYGGVR